MRGVRLGLGLAAGGVSASPPAYTPAAAPGVVLYLNAATLAASPVSSWSYGAGNFVQASSPSQPTWTATSANVNSKPSVIYNSTKEMSATSTTALQLTGNFTISTVVYFSTLNSFNCIVSKYNASGEFDIYVHGGLITLVQYTAGTGTTVTSAAGAIPSVGLYLITIIKTGTSISFRVNGIAVGTATITPVPTATTNNITIGQRSDAVTVLNGEQPFVFLSNHALSGADLSNLETFASTTWQ